MFHPSGGVQVKRWQQAGEPKPVEADFCRHVRNRSDRLQGREARDTLCPRRASPWAVPVMEDRDCHRDSWKFVGHDADPGQSGPGAALVGAVSCQISHTAAACDSQPGQTGLPGRNCSGR